MMNECWYTNPFARLPILRIRKILNIVLIQQHNDKEDVS